MLKGEPTQPLGAAPNPLSEVDSLRARLATQAEQIRRLEAELSEVQNRATRFPNDLYAMERLAFRAPSGWHLHLMVEMIVRRLLRHAKSKEPERKEEALEALAEIALKFRLSPKAQAPHWLLEMLKEPAFLTVWNRPLPKRKRGGVAGNETAQVLSIFVEQAMQDYDESVEWDPAVQELPNGGPSRKERYADVEGYLTGFLPFAKRLWEDGGREHAEALLGYLKPEIAIQNPDIMEPAKLRQELPRLQAGERLWLVLRVFGGLSDTELFQLKWESLDFKAGLIRLDSPGSGKRGIQCCATITPEMRKWLKPLARKRGRVAAAFGRTRTNVGRASDLPKRSFGLFKNEIERRARHFLQSWRGAWPP